MQRRKIPPFISNALRHFGLRASPGKRRPVLRDTAYLDGLKGFAAFMVYVHHMTMRWYPALGNWYGRDANSYQLIRLPLLRDVYVSGQSMIGVFFVVSGFVLTTKPLTLARTQDYAGLYKTLSSCVFRRWIRLWLPALATTFMAMIAIRLNFKLDSPGGPYQHPKLGSFYAQFVDWAKEMNRFSTPFQYADHHEQLRCRYDWVLWTLPLEYWSGIAIWVVCLALCQFPRYFVRLVILLFACWYSLYHGAWFFFCFLAGMAIADFQIESKTFKAEGFFFRIFTHKRRQVFYWSLFVFGLYVAGQPGVPERDIWSMDVPGYRFLYSMVPRWLNEPYRWYLSVTGVCLVFSTNRIRKLQRVFESDIAQEFSKSSYPFFLLHQFMHDMLVMNWLRSAIPRWFRFNPRTKIGHHALFFSCFFITTPIIIVTARIFQRYIDGPCSNFARRLEEFFRSPAAPKSISSVRLLPLVQGDEISTAELEKLNSTSDTRHHDADIKASSISA